MGTLSDSKILIGTSGYSYNEWKSVFYPKDLKSNGMLQYYCQHFPTVEINSSFYQIPSLKTVEVWRNNSHDQFLFSAKIPNLVTHKPLLDPELYKEPLNIYLENMYPLEESGKMLSFLLQLPPKFSFEQHFSRLETFLSDWNNKRDEIKEHNSNKEKFQRNLIVEFRNKDWMQEKSFNLLRDYNATYCTVVEPLLPPTIEITNDLYYMRFHGFGSKIWFDYLFSKEELEAWKPKILDIQNKVKKSIIYFNNHFSGNAVKNAGDLAKILDITTKSKPKGLDRFF